LAKSQTVNAEVIKTKAARMPARRSEVDSKLPALMQTAVEQGPEGVAVLQELVKLKQQVDNEDARRAWHAAVALFQRDCPEIKKTKRGQHGMYAPLGKTLTAVRPHLAKHGLSVTWITRRYDNEPFPYKVCRLAHELGHVEEAECPIIIDEDAGKTREGNDTLNAMQKYGIADSYAERYSFEAVAGLAAEDDTDGGARAPAVEPPRRKSAPARASKQAPPQSDEEPPHPAETPAPAPAKGAQQTQAQIEVVEVSTRNGTNARGAWTKWTATDADGERYDTFSKSLGTYLECAAGTGELIEVIWEPPQRDGYGRKLIDIVIDEGPQE
jgi:hypothetical protein